MADNGLFRSEVVLARSGRLAGELQLSQPLAVRLISMAGVVIIVVLALLLVHGSLSRKVTVAGELRPSLGLLTVAAPRDGVLQSVHVDEGMQVAAGQPLAMIGTPHTTHDHDTAKAMLEQVAAKREAADREFAAQREKWEAEREQLRDEIRYLRDEREQIAAKVDIERRSLDVLNELSERYRRLGDDRHVSRLQIQQHEIQVLAAEARYRDARRDLLANGHRLDAAGRRLHTVDAEIALSATRHATLVAESALATVEIGASSSWLVTAPVDGMVSAQMSNVGQAVAAGDPLLHVVPKGSRLEARLMIPTRAIGFVARDSRVRLRVDAFPYQVFGHVDGTVTAISESAVGAGIRDGVGDSAHYLATVEIDPTVDAARLPLRAGMRIEADLHLESRRLYEWVLEPLYRTAGAAGG